MTNIFTGLINSAFKDIFNQAIDSLLDVGALSIPCRLQYNKEYSETSYCGNCIYDPISEASSNTYNNSTGYVSFPNGSICPVCNGFGKIILDSNETVYLGVILDGKYWLNYGPNFVQIPNLSAQTLCKIELSPKIAQATSMVLVDSYDYSPTVYTKLGAPIPMGLGDHKYILTNWGK